MNPQSLRATFRTLLSTIAIAKLALVMPVHAQQRLAPAYDPVGAFVGTWTATAPGEQAPFLVLKLRESDGKLTGTASHFKLRAVHGRPGGTPEPGESSIADLTLYPSGDFGFVWDSDPILRGDQVKFSLHGTEEAVLVIMMADREQFEKIADENQHVGGFDPVITLRRGSASEQRQAESSEKWEPGFMVELINTAEAQYRFAYGRYADYPTLLSSRQLEQTRSHEFTAPLRNSQFVDDPLPGYALRLWLSPDGNSYQLSIREKNANCGEGLFSDETGVVVEGRPDGCTAK